MTAAFFIDLPNFYSRLLNSKMAELKVLKEYFLHWLDFDLLAGSLEPSFSGIWVFYSGTRVGPSGERIEGPYLTDYINRINSLQGVTARDVNIRGEQREPMRVVCENCGTETTAEWKSEKGIDSSLVVHLFDTMDSWDVAYLLSGDADYVPAVASLRRRGKIVIGGGFSDASPALIRECYQYLDLPDVFLRDDLAAYRLLGPGGIAEKWLTDEVKPLDARASVSEVRLSVACDHVPEQNLCELHYTVGGPLDRSSREQQFTEFASAFPDKFKGKSAQENVYYVSLGEVAVESVKRGFERLVRSVNCSGADLSGNHIYCLVDFRYNETIAMYEPIKV